jgi:integrase
MPVSVGGIVNNYPFSIFKRSDRTCFSVAFKTESGKYLKPFSTGKKTEDEAFQVAFKWLRDGVPQRQEQTEALSVNQLAFQDFIRKIDSKADALVILKELKRKGWVKSYTFTGTPAAQVFNDFLLDFWDWETSAYIAEKLRKEHGIHKSHCAQQWQAVKRYWEPFFKGRLLGEITREDLDAFVTYMGTLPLSASRKNVVIKAGTKPLRWAFSKGLIETDFTRGIILFSGEAKERPILTPSAAEALFNANWLDHRAKVANLLAAVTGMRQGEILALRVEDLGEDCLYVRHSWRKKDGLKTTKTNEGRTVEQPFESLMREIIEIARQNPHGTSPESFVFWSEHKADIPMCGDIFRDGLRDVLLKIGYDKATAYQYRFHDWRHYYTSYMIDKVTEKLLQKQTGHKTKVMLRRYGGHLISGDRERVREAQVAAFGGLIPAETTSTYAE